MNWYAQIIAHHPYLIVSAVTVFSSTCLLVSLITTKLPNFSDPQLGFETRGTKLAQRLTAWQNLQEATRPSGRLTVNPKDVPRAISTVPPRPESSLSFFSRNDTEDDEENYVDQEWASLIHGIHPTRHQHQHQHLSNDGFFCGSPSSDYSHLVFQSTIQTESLFTLKQIHAVCYLQKWLMSGMLMSHICQTITDGLCCRTWSLPNYIVLLSNRTNCFEITEEDIEQTKHLLYSCAKFFHNLKLSPGCDENNLCSELPSNCTKHDIVYNILYYLTDTGFLPENYTNHNKSVLDLSYTMLFLPIARSSAVLPYYYSLRNLDLKHENVHVVAMDFGLKNALFDDSIVKDAWFILLGSIFIIFCIWSYTNSIFLTFCTILAVFMSLSSSYFIYTIFFELSFFPFMNVLAAVVAVGIGADDAFIFCKIWECSKLEKSNAAIPGLVSDTMKHAVVSMFVTSLTTAAAFFSNYVSNITAINCFGIYAGTTVLVNFCLMITWLPACVVISERWTCSRIVPTQWAPGFNTRIRTMREYTDQVRVQVDRCLLLSVGRLTWLWLLLFSCLAVSSCVVVLYYPKLKLPDTNDFPLFESKHLFEQYDIKYRQHFWFERLQKTDAWSNTNEKLPLRFVWGVLPVDNGNYLDPASKGSLVFDETFDMAAAESQVWLLNFCRRLRTQKFYQSTLGPLLPNCFIESFANWMHRRCVDAIDKIDRSPCCESSRFPYTRQVFNTCIVDAIAHLYETPADYFLPGVAGPKFSTKQRDRILAVVVEYDSNYSYSLSYNEMNEFYQQVEDWFQQQLLTAPDGMKHGWFISHLSFYDLQMTLSQGTVFAILCSMLISFVVVFVATLDLLVTLYSIITIAFIIFVTVGCLVLLGWKLNVLESVIVTSAIGLAIDFSLHYSVNYRLSQENDRITGVTFALSKMAGPTAMAAITTGAAGIFMLPSSVLAYIQIGTFLVIIMSVSWLYSTMFLMSLLHVAGPQRGTCQFAYSSLGKCCVREEPTPGRVKTLYRGVTSESTSSTVCNLQQSGSETHELDSIAKTSRRNRRVTRSEQSPSATSAITIIPADEVLADR